MGFAGGDFIYELYVDMYFLFNFWMNLWVLFLCRFFIGSNVKRKRVIVCALFAAMGETILLCIPTESSGVKIVIGFGGITVFLCYFLFKPKSRQYYYRILTFCYMSAFLVGGLLLIVEGLWKRRKISHWVLGILVVLFVYLIEITYKKLNKKNDYYEVTIFLTEDKQISVTALLDTGNGLVEPISKLPVSILEEDAVKEYKQELQPNNLRMVPYHSIGKEKGILEAYFVKKMEIKREGEDVIIRRPMIAITKDDVSKNGYYQMILHPEILN